MVAPDATAAPARTAHAMTPKRTPVDRHQQVGVCGAVGVVGAKRVKNKRVGCGERADEAGGPCAGELPDRSIQKDHVRGEKHTLDDVIGCQRGGDSVHEICRQQPRESFRLIEKRVARQTLGERAREPQVVPRVHPPERRVRNEDVGNEREHDDERCRGQRRGGERPGPRVEIEGRTTARRRRRRLGPTD